MGDVDKGISSFLTFLEVLTLNEDTAPITCIILSYWKNIWC